MDAGQHADRVESPVHADAVDPVDQLLAVNPDHDVRAVRAAFGADQADIRVLAAAESDDPRARGFGPVGAEIEVRVVPVQHRKAAVFFQAFEDFALGFGDLLQVAEMPDMGFLDIGDDGEVGADQPGQIGNLAEMVHAKLEHGVIRVPGEPGQTEWRADMIVQITRAGMDRTKGGKRCRQGILGAGLADAAGHGQHFCRCARPGRHRDIREAAENVFDHEQGSVAAQPVRDAADQCCRRSGVKRGGDIIMTVDPFARQGDKQAARCDFAAVDNQIRNLEGGPVKVAARRLDQLVRCP